MVRKLKYHEQKLLKKVDFINWEVDNNLHEVKVLRKYRIERREDYTKWVTASARLVYPAGYEQRENGVVSGDTRLYEDFNLEINSPLVD